MSRPHPGSVDEAVDPRIPDDFNLAGHLLDARIAEGAGARTAILTPERAYAYGDVYEQANRVAHVLRAAGVRKGDRVLIALPDGFEFAAALFATLKLGAVAATMNPDIPSGDSTRFVHYTAPRAFIASPAVAMRATEARAAAPGLALALVTGTVEDAKPFAGLGWTSFAARCQEAPTTFTNENTHAGDQALWLFSSGSTGEPKAAVHAHRDFAYHIECYAKGILRLASTDVTLAVPRLYFPYATGMNLLFPFAVGATTILFPEHPTPERIFELCARFSPTVLTTVPTMTAKMLALAEGTRSLDAADVRAALASVRVAVTAGEALPPTLHQRWLDTFGVEMLDGIGSAEMFHIYISNRIGDVRPGSLGRVVPGYRVRLVRPDGTDAAVDETGTLWVTGGSVFSEYYDAPEKTRAVLKDGWVVSGDSFRRDPDGYFHYEGRADDMLKVGGIYVSPLEVEIVIGAHPAVAECAVVGYEDDVGLTKPRAFVVARPGRAADDALFAELAAWARERLAHYKVPRSWVGRTSLPRNDRGKIVRRLLRGDLLRGDLAK
jgi:benzoate-CoA ligase family protein